MEPSKAELSQGLAELLSDVVTAKFILHGYHWNVISPNFSQYHSFFGMLYSDYDSSVDDIAENIRKLGLQAPYLLTDFVEMSHIQESRVDGSSVEELFQSALRINSHLVECHYRMFAAANEANRQGLADFLAGRIDILEKWNWQIKAHLGVS